MTPRIHSVAADADKFFVNAFLIEGETEVVLVDTHFVISSARRVAAEVAKLEKPLAAIIITHPHPDHYNGLPVILKGHPTVPVYATRATIKGIAATQAAKRAAWAPIYGDDYPTEDGLPDHEIDASGVLKLAGMTLQSFDLGGFECALDNTLIYVPQARALIASDLIYNNCHPWLAEHHTAEWLEQLNFVEDRFANIEAVYAGHGKSGGKELFGQQRGYIEDFRALVRERARGSVLSAPALSDIAAQTRNGRDGWPLDGLIEMNARAVAEELAR